MGGWNLPPGVSSSSIPGNRASDAAWETWVEGLKPGDPVEVEHWTERDCRKVMLGFLPATFVEHYSDSDALVRLLPEDPENPGGSIVPWLALHPPSEGLDAPDDDTEVELDDPTVEVEAVLEEPAVICALLRWSPVRGEYVVDGLRDSDQGRREIDLELRYADPNTEWARALAELREEAPGAERTIGGNGAELALRIRRV